MIRKYRTLTLYIISGLFIGLLFITDLIVPGGPAPAIGYCAVVVLASQSGRRGVTLGVVGICILLTGLGLGYDLNNLHHPLWISLLDTGMVMGIIAMTGALTLMRQRNLRDLQQRTDELAQSNRDLEQFATAVSHDLRTPLTSISGCARLLDERLGGKSDADSRELLGFIHESAQRMGAMIARMLHYARVGARPLELKRCDLDLTLSGVLADLRAVVEDSGGKVTHDPLPILHADERLLAQVLQNLIENAIKYRGKDPPRIHVSSSWASREWVLSVRDNGIGIAPSDTDRIFELFERAGQDSSRKPGNGVGLATCKRIIERHGGRIWVESQVGAGSTFHIALPDGQSGR